MRNSCFFTIVFFCTSLLANFPQEVTLGYRLLHQYINEFNSISTRGYSERLEYLARALATHFRLRGDQTQAQHYENYIREIRRDYLWNIVGNLTNRLQVNVRVDQIAMLEQMLMQPEHRPIYEAVLNLVQHNTRDLLGYWRRAIYFLILIRPLLEEERQRQVDLATARLQEWITQEDTELTRREADTFFPVPCGRWRL